MRKGDRAGLGRAAGREGAGKEGLGDAQPSDWGDQDDGPFCGHRGRKKRQLWWETMSSAVAQLMGRGWGDFRWTCGPGTQKTGLDKR